MTKSRIGRASALLLVAASAALTVNAGTAGAATAADPNCTGYGLAARVDQADIRNRTTGTVVGVVQLCQRRDSTGAMIRWSAVTLRYTMRAGDWANGRVQSRRVGSPSYVSAECKYGTGVIVAPDRTCASNGTPRVSGFQDAADAYVYNSNNVILAAGITGWHY